MAVLITPSWSSLRFYANEKLLITQGQPGTTKSYTQSYNVAFFEPYDETVLTAEVSNYSFFQKDSLCRIDEHLIRESEFIISDPGRRDVKMILHTLKGNVLSFKISHVLPLDAVCHELEEKSTFNRNDYNLVKDTFKKCLIENAKTLSIILGKKSQGIVAFSGNIIKRFMALLDKLGDSDSESSKPKRELIAAGNGFIFKDILHGWELETKRLAEKLQKNVIFEAKLPDSIHNGDLYPYKRLFNVLIHAIRNAVDHGIEPIAERLKAGKAECATITFEFVQLQDGSITIVLSDDGRGLSRTKVTTKAMTTLDMLATDHRLSDKEWPLLIFEHGFSTKEKEEITDISGRGIGMASIKSAIDELGGHLAVESMKGHGFKLICQFKSDQNIASLDSIA